MANPYQGYTWRRGCALILCNVCGAHVGERITAYRKRGMVINREKN